MPELLAVAALTLMFSLFLGLLRVMRGPGPGDRMLAAQLIGTSGVGMLLLLGVLLGQPALIDVDATPIAYRSAGDPGTPLVLFLHGLGLTELGTFFAAVASRVGRGEALLATLLFPTTAPIFISAVKCTASLLEGKGLGGAAGTWLIVTIGFDILFFLVALATFEFVLEE